MTTPKSLPNDLIDGLLANYKKPEDLIGENGLLKQLTKALVERALQAEMSEHLGHDKHAPVTNPSGNARNGKSRKTLKGEFGELPIEVPRDREGSFEPQLIPKHQTRWTGFDDKIISLYARGMTVREIQAHLTDMYGTEVSPTLISSVTDAVVDDVKQWQSRPLDAIYPVVYLDCIHVKVRDAGAVRAKAVYLAIGINMEGEKEVLGLWIAQTEGAKFWLSVVTELKNHTSKIVEVQLELYLNAKDSNRSPFSIIFQGVESISQIVSLDRLEQNAFAGSINYWIPEQNGGTTFIYLTDGCIAIESTKIQLKSR